MHHLHYFIQTPFGKAIEIVVTPPSIGLKQQLVASLYHKLILLQLASKC